MKKQLLVGACAVAIFSGGFLSGQSTPLQAETREKIAAPMPPKAQQNFSSDFMSAAAMGDVMDKQNFHYALVRATGNRELTESIGKVVVDWETPAKPKETTIGTLLIFQNQKLIEQNQKIIELLTQIKAKK